MTTQLQFPITHEPQNHYVDGRLQQSLSIVQTTETKIEYTKRFYRVQICYFDLDCNKDNCRRLHSWQKLGDLAEEIKTVKDYAQTRPCPDYGLYSGEKCPNDACTYAHKPEELRVLDCDYGV